MNDRDDQRPRPGRARGNPSFTPIERDDHGRRRHQIAQRVVRVGEQHFAAAGASPALRS